MRRPTPLPPSASPRAEEEPAEAPAELELPAWARTPAPEDSPLDRAAEPASPAVARPATLADTPGTADPGEQPVGMRDVWRAARARRRALRAEVRRFTVRQRRRRMLWLAVAIAVVVLVLATVGAAYSPLFAVRSIEVVGTSQLDAAQVEQALSAQQGAPLALVDADAVQAALAEFPLVESYTLEARPPGDLVVRIVERTPVGVLASASGFTLVDAAGVALTSTPEAPAGQPVLEITGGVRSDAFRAAGQVVRSLPDSIRPLVTAVSATTPDDVTLTLGATDTTIVWGSAEESALKAYTLERTMVQNPPDATRLYDVSSPRAVVVG
jgi:cell division protein FtsQ